MGKTPNGRRIIEYIVFMFVVLDYCCCSIFFLLFRFFFFFFFIIFSRVLTKVITTSTILQWDLVRWAAVLPIMHRWATRTPSTREIADDL